MTLNLKKYQRDLSASWERFVKESVAGSWVIFGFEGKTLDLMTCGSGDGGVEEMIYDLSDGRMMYAGVCVKDPNSGLPKIVFILWQGLGVPEQVRGKVATYSNEIRAFFKGFHIDIVARSEDEIAQSVIEKKVQSSSGANYSIHKEVKKEEPPPPTHAINKINKINPSAEINANAREEFWKQQKSNLDSAPKVNVSAQRAAEVAALKSKPSTDRVSDVNDSQSKLNEIREARQKELEESLKKTKVTQEEVSTSDRGQEIKEARRREMEALLKQSKETPIPSSQNTTDSAAAIKLQREREMEALLKQSKETPIPNSQNTTDSAAAIKLQREREMKEAISISKTQSIKVEEPKKVTNNVSARFNPSATTNNDAPQPKKFEPVASVSVNQLKAKISSALEKPVQQEPEKVAEPVSTPSPQAAPVQEEPVEEQQPVREEPSAAPPRAAPSIEKTTLCEVLYDYSAEESGELTIKEGDILKLIEAKEDDHWWLAENSKGEQGLIPSNYVKLTSEGNEGSHLDSSANLEPKSDSQPEQSGAEDGFTILVGFDYDANDVDELTIKEGEYVKYVNRREDGWWEVENKQGQRGLVPSNYLESQ